MTETTVFQMKLSTRQRPALDVLAGEVAPASYIRRLIAEDAERRGLPWPDDLPDVGARGAGRRKKKTDE